MILRIWHGYTLPENADAYEALLKREIFGGIEAMGLRGFQGIELLRRSHENETEFVTIMRFAELDDLRAFTGKDYETAYVPDAARKLLTRFDARTRHYDLRESRTFEA